MVSQRETTLLTMAVLMISGALSIPTQGDSNNKGTTKRESFNNHSQVIIIGAGVSGTTAAARLLEHGINDVVILEAEERMGGRVHSVPFGDGVVDLGAQWVHGAKGNVIYDMAKPLGLLDETSRSAVDTCLYLTSKFQVDAELVDKFNKLTCAILFYHDALSIYNGSLGEFFQEKFTVWSLNPKNGVSKDLSLIPLYIPWIEKILAYESGTDSWFKVSAKGLPQFWDIPGHQTTTFKKNGLGSIIDLITKRYPNPEKELPIRNKTHLGAEVKSIRWGSRGIVGPTGKKAIVVKTSDGAQFTSDFVILTASLGVLKEKASTMFNPPIPEEKLNTIQHLAFGAVEQLFFEFNETWWPTNVTGISVLSTDEDNQRFNKLYPKFSEKGEWTNGLTGLYLSSGQPRSVLFCWLSGEPARIMLKYSDEDVTAGVLRWFEMFTNKTVPPPVAFLRSKWSENAHFRGSFTHRILDSERYEAWPAQLSEPLIGLDGHPEILFAGEATSKHHYSTVHGAMETGRREADRILDFLRKTEKLPKTSNQI